MVYRRHHHYFIALFCETLYGECQPTDNTRHKSQFFTLNFPAMAILQPIDNGSIPLFAGKSITQHFVFQPFSQSFHYEWWSTEIHIRYPHREQIITSPTFAHGIPLYGFRSTTVYYFIKIIFHLNILF